MAPKTTKTPKQKVKVIGILSYLLLQFVQMDLIGHMWPMPPRGTTSNIGVSLISLHHTPRPHTLNRVIRNLMRLAHI